MILKLDGYVTKGMEGAGEKVYTYDVLYKQYVKDRVYFISMRTAGSMPAKRSAAAPYISESAHLKGRFPRAITHRAVPFSF